MFQVKRQLNRRMSSHNGCLGFRRDDRRRRFGSMAHDTTRRTDCPTINNAGNASGGISSSTIVPADRTFQQRMLVNGGSQLNGSRHNSNESHSMTTIDETEQDCLLKGTEDQPQLSIEVPSKTADGTYRRLNENPETTL